MYIYPLNSLQLEMDNDADEYDLTDIYECIY